MKKFKPYHKIMALWSLCIPVYAHAQQSKTTEIEPQLTTQIVYRYDERGNRVERNVIIIKETEIKQDSITNDGDIKDLADTAYLDHVYVQSLDGASIKVYPNPTKGKLYIHCDNTSNSSPTEMSLIELGGSVIEQQVLTSNNMVLDLSNRSRGIYILRMRNKYSEITWKIIKE